MFTGIIQTVGNIGERKITGGSGTLTVMPEKPFTSLQTGESIAVNGVCLTLERREPDGRLIFHTLEETLSRTNLGRLPPGGKVNLERALQLHDRLGGHLVTGHIDAAAPVLACGRRGADYEVKIAAPESMQPFLVEKGCIAVDGISLTIVAVTPEFFTVCLIPLTLASTCLEARTVGTRVNLEADLIGKYVQKQLALTHGGESRLSMEALQHAGWH